MCRWKNNIKMDVREVGWGMDMDRNGSEYRQVADPCECGNELSDFIKFGEFLD